MVLNERLYTPHCIIYMKADRFFLEFWPVFCLKSNIHLLRNLETDAGNGTGCLAR